MVKTKTIVETRSIVYVDHGRGNEYGIEKLETQNDIVSDVLTMDQSCLTTSAIKPHKKELISNRLGQCNLADILNPLFPAEIYCHDFLSG